MIDAHALESGRTPHDASVTGGHDRSVAGPAHARHSRWDEFNAAPPAANRKWYLHIWITGLIVAIGGVTYVQEARKAPPPVVAADEELGLRSGVIGKANETDKPVEKPLQAEEPGALGTIRVEKGQTAEGGAATRGTSVAHSDDREGAPPVVGQPIKEIAAGAENRADDPAEVPKSSKAARTDPVAPVTKTADEEALPLDAPTPSAPPLAGETESAIESVKGPAAEHVARVLFDVNMRAGPSNGQAVLATIPHGKSVDVIKCRQWCEVIFAGQRGWVYKSFIEVLSHTGQR